MSPRPLQGELVEKASEMLLVRDPTACDFANSTNYYCPVACHCRRSQGFHTEEMREKVRYDRSSGIEWIVSNFLTPAAVDTPLAIIDRLGTLSVSRGDSPSHLL